MRRGQPPSQPSPVPIGTRDLRQRGEGAKEGLPPRPARLPRPVPIRGLPDSFGNYVIRDLRMRGRTGLATTKGGEVATRSDLPDFPDFPDFFGIFDFGVFDFGVSDRTSGSCNGRILKQTLGAAVEREARPRRERQGGIIGALDYAGLPCHCPAEICYTATVVHLKDFPLLSVGGSLWRT